MVLPLNCFGKMKKIKSAFPLLLLTLLVNLLHAQQPLITAEGLWPGAISFQPQCRYRVAAPLAAWPPLAYPSVAEQWIPKEGKMMYCRVINHAEKMEPEYHQLWDVAADGQPKNVQYWGAMTTDTTTWRYRYNPAGVLTGIFVDGTPAYSYEYEPDTAPLRELLDKLPLKSTSPDLPMDTVLVMDEQNGDQHWLLVNGNEQLAAYLVLDKEGQLTNHEVYAYLDVEGPDIVSRTRINMLSTQQEYTYISPSSLTAFETAERLQSGVWYAAWGKSPLLYLHPTGRMLWMSHPEEGLIEGSWKRKKGQLVLQLDNRRVPLVYQEVSEEKTDLQLYHAEDKVFLPMLKMLEVPTVLQQAANQLALEQWEIFKEGDRVGLKHSLDNRQLPAKYDDVEAATAEYAIVTLDNLQGIVRYDGQTLSPIYYQNLSVVTENLLVGKRRGLCALIRPDGDTVSAYAYDRLLIDDSNFRAVKSGKMGVLGLGGETLIPFRFDSLSTTFGYHQRFAWSGGQPGVIDEDGKWAVEPGLYLQIMAAGKNRLLVRGLTGQWGILASNGKVLVEPQYAHLRALGPAVFVAQLDGQFGLLDGDGQALTPLKYQLIKGCEPQAGQGLCETLLAYNAVAQFISADGFGYLDAYGREHPPRLPSEKTLDSAYETVAASEKLELTFPKAKWRWEPSAKRLYKQGDYGRVRVFYEQIELGGIEPEAWLEDNLPGYIHQRLQRQEVGGQPAWVVSEVKRIRYYDFRKKYAYVPLAGGQLLRLEFSCKAANYLENAQDLYEIEQLLQVGI